MLDVNRAEPQLWARRPDQPGNRRCRITVHSSDWILKMRITDVRACQPVTPDSPEDWRTSLGQILIAVDTDSGITGYGVGGGGFAGIHIVRTVLRDLLLGQDPSQIESLWDLMFGSTLAYGQKGLVVMAISGVDLALWDVRGRAEQSSICKLLGGSSRNRLPTYITVWDNEAMDDVCSSPHQGFKLHLGGQLPEDHHSTDAFADRVADQLQRARSAVGPDRELMADAWMKWNLEETQAVIDRVSDVNLSWLEEPLPVHDESGYAKLVQSSTVPIAGGEHEYTSAEFRNLAEKRLHSVLQPDICWCGGLTELIRIYRIAAEFGLRVCPHRGAELWSLPAIAALDQGPAAPLAESGRPWMSWVQGQPSIEDGFVEVPDRPGFGLMIDEAAITAYPSPTYDQWRK